MKSFREGRVNRDQVFDKRTAWNHIVGIAKSVGVSARYGEANGDSFTADFSSGDGRLATSTLRSSIYSTTVNFTFKDSGYTIDDEHADYDRFQGDFSKGWVEFDQDVKDLLTDMIDNFSKKEMKESIVPADQESVLRSVVKDMYPQYAGLVDDYLNNGLDGCEGAFESDNDLIDDFVAYAEYILGK